MKINFITLVEASSETQCRSVESGKTATKVFKTGRESLWNATLNQPVPRLIRRLVCDLAKTIILCPTRGQHLSRCFRNLLKRRRLPPNSTVHRTCLALASELSLAKMEPKTPRALSIQQKFRFQISEIYEPNGSVHSGCIDPTQATARLVIVLVTRIQGSSTGNNNFVKWKGTFPSYRP